MRIKLSIPLSAIIVDREPIGPDTLAIVDHLRTGGTVPPIHVVKLSHGLFKILDGRHRVLAHKLLGLPSINAKFYVSSVGDTPDNLPTFDVRPYVV